ncbi:soluble interferon gamma receptor B8 [BeAn 58058 virus]|uniref:soluble interferon gamma receptor B8 n=1 Tax=BeAn 58058 virus TaxID=67082 RepID=UPI000909CA27|nr:soluble interferon gamma receptor B8 [BeAn 58058 virus]APG58210.1 soluble interferon gamma receptor B8 [BeAn 58058 virus]
MKTLLLISICLYVVTSLKVKITSNNFKSVVQWNDDKKYNVSIHNGNGWDTNFCRDVENKCEITDLVLTYKNKDFRLKIENDGNVIFDKNMGSICNYLHVNSPKN